MFILKEEFLKMEGAANTSRSGWSAVHSALVADVLRGDLHLRVRGEIHGESMLPTLWPGDVVEIESCSLQDVRPGETVLARRHDRLVLHRLVALCTPNGVLLRGDCVPRSDPQYPLEALLGRLVRKTEGRLLAATASRALGRLFCHCGVVRRLALMFHDRPRRNRIGADLRSLESF
jgi:hypothetical protein